jgi:hypothetical protein
MLDPCYAWLLRSAWLGASKGWSMASALPGTWFRLQIVRENMSLDYALLYNVAVGHVVRALEFFFQHIQDKRPMVALIG